MPVLKIKKSGKWTKVGVAAQGPPGAGAIVPVAPEKKPFAECTWPEIAYIAKNFDPSEYWKTGDMKRFEFAPGYSVPMVIVDFNRYNVVDVLGYGKKKAGLVLQLGSDRARNGDNISGVFEPLRSGFPAALIDERGLFKSPNKMALDSEGAVVEAATWWAEGAVREKLQTIFNDTELETLIVPVEVVTSKYCNENNGYENWTVTHDRVFLPSETELYGKQYLSPAIEGEMLEYYRKGASRFFWGEYTLANAASYIGTAGWSIWTRSSAQRDTAGAAAKLTTSAEVRKATCRVYNSVLRAATATVPGSYGHGYSIAEGATTGGYYVPLFCL